MLGIPQPHLGDLPTWIGALTSGLALIVLALVYRRDQLDRRAEAALARTRPATAFHIWLERAFVPVGRALVRDDGPNADVRAAQGIRKVQIGTAEPYYFQPDVRLMVHNAGELPIYAPSVQIAWDAVWVPASTETNVPSTGFTASGTWARSFSSTRARRERVHTTAWPAPDAGILQQLLGSAAREGELLEIAHPLHTQPADLAEQAKLALTLAIDAEPANGSEELAGLVATILDTRFTDSYGTAWRRSPDGVLAVLEPTDGPVAAEPAARAGVPDREPAEDSSMESLLR